MTRFYAQRGRALIPLVLSLCWVGCSRPGSSGAQAGQRVPFGAGEAAAQTTTSGPSAPLPENTSSPANDVPFRDPLSLPAGTLLTVRLQNPIVSTNGAQTDNTFGAVLDDAVVIDEVTLVPAGASVTGQIGSVKPSGAKPNRGLVRLALNSIEVDGRDLPIQTSVLYARGKPNQLRSVNASSTAVVRLEPGRRLTFRLAEPVSIASQLAKSGH